MNTVHRSLAAALVTAAALSFSIPAAQAQHSTHTATTARATTKPTTLETRDALRDLWLEHIFWVRNVVVATLANDTPARAAAEKSVVANARQIADSITPFYGQPAADKLFTLLAGHYGAVKQYLDAGTDTAKQGAATKALTDNAGEIATFLSGANPNLPHDAVLGMLAAHAGHHISQINELRAKQYEDEARTWDAMRNHMYKLADTLAGAIAKQFPDKFAG